MWRWVSRLLLTLGVLLITLGVAYGGLIGYLAWRESSAPSTSRVLVLKDGQRIPLVQPTQPIPASLAPAAPGAPISNLPGDGDGPPAVAGPTFSPPATAVAFLPPLRIVIPRIGVDWPVVLSVNEALPRFKGVGWLMGSTYPGFAGNLVLFGHLDGPYATLGRLHELVAGDTFSVVTEAGDRVYRVRSSFDVTPDDVGVLAPTSTATATLITCSGHWDKVVKQYDHRLVVLADYIGN